MRAPGEGIDVARARAETPGCASVVHFNHAGASLLPTPVLDTVIAHLRREAEIGGYEAAEEAADRAAGVRESVAGLVGADPGEIALVDSATRAWQIALGGIRFSAGDRILTARSEYGSNLIALAQVAERTDARVVLVDDDEAGEVDLEALARELDRGPTALVALTHVPTAGGLVNPAAAVGRLCRAAGVPFLLDACQSVGQMPVDVADLGCDLLAATGRKFLRGPRGTGFLYVRASVMDRLEPPLMDIGSAQWESPGHISAQVDARRFEIWEHDVAARLGLGRAVDYARGWGLDAIAARVEQTGRLLRDRLGELDGVTVHDRGRRLCGIVTFTVRPAGSVGGPRSSLDCAAVRSTLRSRRINVSTSSVGHSPYHLGATAPAEVVRASVHYTTTPDEIDELVGAIGEISRSG